MAWIIGTLVLYSGYMTWMSLSLTSSVGQLILLMKEYRSQASAWQKFANDISDLVKVRGGLEAILDGKDIVLEHPDPAKQAEANRIMTDLRRLALSIRNAQTGKGSSETN